MEGGEGVMGGWGRRSFKNKTKKIGRWGQAYLYVHSATKSAWSFEQQIELFLISCLAVAKSVSVWSLVQHIKLFLEKGVDIIFSFNVFLWTCKYFYRHHIYFSVQKIVIFYIEFTKKSLFSLFLPANFSFKIS